MNSTTAKIEPDQTWVEYIASLKALVNGKTCPHVAVVPNLHGNNLGVICGRLCNPAVTIGDSPMRVATGALIGLGADPAGSGSETLSMAHLTEITAARLSVPQWYVGYPGIYWGDHPMLDTPGGDFQVYEYLRCIQAGTHSRH